MRSAWKVRLAGLPPVRLAVCGSAARISSTRRALLLNGSFLALAHDRGDDPLGLLLLAVGPQDADEFARRVGAEDLRGAHAGRLVHAHVERGVLGVGEAAVRLVELHGGDAEVEQHALDARDAEPVEYVGQLVVDGVHQGGALPVRASRSPDRRRASLSRSRATSRASGKRSRSAPLCPPSPSVQSTTTAPGSSRAGASRSRHRWSITGTCRLWPGGAAPQVRRGVTHRRVPSRPLVKGGPPAPEASAGREREEAELYVRAAHVGRSGGTSPRSPGISVQQGEPRLPLRVTLVHPVARSINRPARRGRRRPQTGAAPLFTRTDAPASPCGLAPQQALMTFFVPASQRATEGDGQ